MKLDKRHLVVSIVLLIAAVVYNIWVFTRPASGGAVVNAATSADQGPIAASGVLVDGTAVAPAVDPTQPVELPEVALDRLPVFPRNPFADVQRTVAPVVEVGSAPLLPAAAPEPDPVIGSILYSSARRLVTIDGRVARVGDVVDGIRIVDILPNAVIVESPQRGRRTLSVGAGVRR